MQRAGTAVGTVAAPKEAVLKQSRSFHTLQDLPGRDPGRRARQRMTVAPTRRGDENSMAHQPLEDFGQERSGYGLCRSDVGERDGLTERMGGQNRQPPKGVLASLGELHPEQSGPELSRECKPLRERP